MGFGASPGWLASVVSIGAFSVAACGGDSESNSDDSSDDAFGGSSGSAAGGASSGGTSQGGSAPTGGVSQGGTIAVGGTGSGTGGSLSIGGAGTGGAPSCSGCPMTAGYGLVVEGDGPTYTMPYNGFIDPGADRAPLPCPEAPLRGAVGGCVRSISVSACEGAMSGPPCLEIGGVAVRYVSRGGNLFAGRVTSDVPATSVSGVVSGVFTIEVTNAAGDTLGLTVSYTFCASLLSNLRIVC